MTQNFIVKKNNLTRLFSVISKFRSIKLCPWLISWLGESVLITLLKKLFKCIFFIHRPQWIFFLTNDLFSKRPVINSRSIKYAIDTVPPKKKFYALELVCGNFSAWINTSVHVIKGSLLSKNLLNIEEEEGHFLVY